MTRNETVFKIALDVTDKRKQRRERLFDQIVYQLVFWGMIGSALTLWVAATIGVLTLLGWWH